MRISLLRLALLAFVSFLVACGNNTATSESPDWSHNFIVWNGDMYIVSEEIINESDLDMELGKVDEYSSNEIDNIDTNLVFSNHFSEGSIVFKIIGVKESESLVVKEGDTLTKLNNNGKYGQ